MTRLRISNVVDHIIQLGEVIMMSSKIKEIDHVQYIVAQIEFVRELNKTRSEFDLHCLIVQTGSRSLFHHHIYLQTTPVRSISRSSATSKGFLCEYWPKGETAGWLLCKGASGRPANSDVDPDLTERTTWTTSWTDYHTSSGQGRYRAK